MDHLLVVILDCVNILFRPMLLDVAAETIQYIFDERPGWQFATSAGMTGGASVSSGLLFPFRSACTKDPSTMIVNANNPISWTNIDFAGLSSPSNMSRTHDP
jgi:hypothetical protein